MRNHCSYLVRHRMAGWMLAAGLTATALGLGPARAGATVLHPASSGASALSLTMTGQTGTSTWSANPVTVTATSSTTDGTNPVYETVCSVDQGAATTVLGTQEKVPVSGDGAHIVECYPIAWDGTQGAPQFATVQLDDQIPSVALSGAPASPTWNSGSVTVTANASEAQPFSGIQSVTCLDGAGGKTTTPGSVGSITVAGTQRYSVSCYATTNAGVTGARTYEQVWVDNTPATVAYTTSPDPTQWYNGGQPVVIDVQTPSGAAPIQSLTCDYNGRAVLPDGQLTEQAPTAVHNWSVALTLPSNDSGDLSCFAGDAAGNVGQNVNVSQKVDTQAPFAFFIKNPDNPDVVLAKVSDALSGVYGANIEYQQHGRWTTLPTVVKHGVARALIPANNPIKPGKHALRIVVTDNADNAFYGTKYQNGTTAVLDYPVAAALHLLYTVTPTGRDLYGHPATNTATNSVLRLAYGQTATIHGQLESTARTLISKQNVRITVTLANHQHYTVLRRTNARGMWSYHLPAGADRSVKVAFAGSVGLAAATHTITIRNQAAVTLAFNPMHYGVWTLVDARVLGGSIPAHGLWVIVQWRRNANSPWETFAHLRRTAPDGVMRVGVPVPGVAAGTHVQLRAFVVPAAGWGYAGATSPILSTVVR